MEGRHALPFLRPRSRCWLSCLGPAVCHMSFSIWTKQSPPGAGRAAQTRRVPAVWTPERRGGRAAGGPGGR